MYGNDFPLPPGFTKGANGQVTDQSGRVLSIDEVNGLRQRAQNLRSQLPQSQQVSGQVAGQNQNLNTGSWGNNPFGNNNGGM